MEPIRKAEKVRFTVIRQLPLGLLVELADGRTGIIRSREISWNRQERLSWREQCPIGWTSQAVIIESTEKDHLQLSLRLAQSDPWEHLPEFLRQDSLVEGIVTGVVTYGAFVEFTPGVTGLLHYSQLPKWAKQKPLELFWPGDRVLVTVTKIDKAHRSISLGLPEGTSPEPDQDRPATPPKTAPLLENRPYGVTHQILDALVDRSPYKNHILIVDQEPQQAKLVASWLQYLKQRVYPVGTCEGALDLLEKVQTDIALINLGQPALDALEAAKAIQQKWPHVKIVLLAEWGQMDELSPTLEASWAEPITVLVKPVLPEDLFDLLVPTEAHAAGNGVDLPVPGSGPASGMDPGLVDPPGSSGDFSSFNRKNLALNQALQSILDTCREWLGFRSIFLFRLDPLYQTIKLVQWGGDLGLNKSALPSMIYSPVRDVAEDGDVIAISQVKEEQHLRFRYLLEAYPLAACIGVPIQSSIIDPHALFLLDNTSQPITREDLTYARAAALVIGQRLERHALEERSSLVQRSAMLGHLTQSLVHEVNNTLGVLSEQVDGLSKDLQTIETGRNDPRSDGGLRAVHQDLRSLQRSVQAAKSTLRIFGRLSRKTSEVVRVDEVIYDATQMMTEYASKVGVKIDFTPPDGLLLTRSQVTALEHVVLNLLLNAVQQIQALGREAGRVDVRIRALPGKDSAKKFHILITDNGPGIHTALWDKIFEPGFTTRKDGSGMGLYISQNLVEDMGGKIYVEKSYILGGTTFVVELPCEF